jgi:hypothetical protein
MTRRLMRTAQAAARWTKAVSQMAQRLMQNGRFLRRAAWTAQLTKPAAH